MTEYEKMLNNLPYFVRRQPYAGPPSDVDIHGRIAHFRRTAQRLAVDRGLPGVGG